MDNYIKGDRLGEGAFGVVYRAVRKRDGRTVAIKKFKQALTSEGLDPTGLREVRFGKELKHPNITEVVDTFWHRCNLYMVFEFLPLDLEKVIKNQSLILSEGNIKYLMKNILNGVKHMHDNYVLHRDIKPSNILISESGELKLGDLGLARMYGSPSGKLSPDRVTSWYRPVELFFGAQLYGPAVDMWSCGTLMAELIRRHPLFDGQTDLEIIHKIVGVLGNPTESIWPGVTHLPQYTEFEPTAPVPMDQLLPTAGDECRDLVSKMLCLDPKKRITAADALEHPFFKSGSEAQCPDAIVSETAEPMSKDSSAKRQRMN